MTGIRVNIQTGEILRLKDPRQITYEVRICERCHHNFEVKRWMKNRYCSISCASRGRQNRLGAKHTPQTIEKMKRGITLRYTAPPYEILPATRIRNRMKKPHFVNDPYQWANATYGKYRAQNKIPHPKTDDYGLYKYGEWLFKNERYAI